MICRFSFMDEIFTDWRIFGGGNRRGSPVTLANGDKRVHGVVVDFIDENSYECPRKHARFCRVRRWSYNDDSAGLPELMVIPVGEPPQYESHHYHLRASAE
jgi:hypothetical protein